MLRTSLGRETEQGAHTLVTDRGVEEGRFLISHLGFDVETRIKSLLLGRVPPSLGFLRTMLLGRVPCEPRGTGIRPLGCYRGITGRSPARLAIPRG